MFGFSKTVIGIDVGACFLRAVKVRFERSGRPVVDGYAEKALPEDILHLSYTKENILDMKRFKELLRLTLDTAGAGESGLALSIPDQVVKVSFIDLKGVPRKRDDVLNFIKWKSKKFLPYDPETAKIDYQMMGNGDIAMAVFVNAVVVADYEEALRGLSLRPRVISTPSMSLYNLFSTRFGDSKEFAFISVRDDSFAVIIMKGGVLDFYRSTDTGLSDERLMQEIASTIMFYLSENQDANIGKIFLHSVSAEDEGLRVGLSEATGLDIESLKLAETVDFQKGVHIEPYCAAVGVTLSIV